MFQLWASGPIEEEEKWYVTCRPRQCDRINLKEGIMDVIDFYILSSSESLALKKEERKPIQGHNTVSIIVHT